MNSLKAIVISVVVLIVGFLGYNVTTGPDVGGMSIRQVMPEVAVFDGVVATTSSARYDVASYRHVTFFLTTADSFVGTVKVKGSEQANVDFTSAQSATNRWDYVQAKILDTGATINGVTGVAFTGTDNHVLYEVNTNYLKNIGFETSDYTTGTVSIFLSGAND